MRMRMRLRRLALLLLGSTVAASIISNIRRPDTTKAPLLAGASIPDEIRSMIERACRDCHSDATRFPWYSRVAPVSWLINRDVRRGRERLNFSKWSEYSLVRRERCLSEIANQVQDGGMPLSIYTLMHRNSKLSRADVDAIFGWTQAERSRLIKESAAAQSSK